MTVTEIRFIRSTFELHPRDLAKIMNVSPATVGRWEAGESTPVGLQDEVLRALHNVALLVKDDEGQRQKVAGIIHLGIGSTIFYLLVPAHQSDGRP